ncbi:hypothetical protein KUH03_17360 [Sphingobacterium sp. E70]|uniref:hypothetical protein n=1 Tax=Sphingobacterium sp. E70 TaxID=2853439 RepID=UPI00211BFCE9|nr:hypothetical protein [Sphingobacterium sp. E70]ULT28200.1 hypothetical protein KUH03_17360 [Sphingobacterium sp. E70]
MNKFSHSSRVYVSQNFIKIGRSNPNFMPSQPSQDKIRINRNIKSTNTDQAYKYFYRPNWGIYSRQMPRSYFRRNIRFKRRLNRKLTSVPISAVHAPYSRSPTEKDAHIPQSVPPIADNRISLSFINRSFLCGAYPLHILGLFPSRSSLSSGPISSLSPSLII